MSIPSFLPGILLFLAGSSCLTAQAVKLEMLNLRTQYENAVDRAVTPLQDRYLASLKKLKETYTKAGDLDSALLVDRELKAESANLNFGKEKLPDTEGELLAFLSANTWIVLDNPSLKYQFSADGKMTYTGAKRDYFFKVTGRRKFEMYWGAKAGEGPITCLVSEDCLAFSETSGERHTWTRQHR